MSNKKSLNEAAKELTLAEGGKKNLSIAQVKEVQKLVAVKLYTDQEYLHAMLDLGKKHAGK